jgi:hypothetical protein
MILLLGAGNTVKRKRRRNVCASTFGGARISAAHAANGSEEVLVEWDHSGAAWDSLELNDRWDADNTLAREHSSIDRR